MMSAISPKTDIHRCEQNVCFVLHKRSFRNSLAQTNAESQGRQSARHHFSADAYRKHRRGNRSLVNWKRLARPRRGAEDCGERGEAAGAATRRGGSRPTWQAAGATAQNIDFYQWQAINLLGREPSLYHLLFSIPP